MTEPTIREVITRYELTMMPDGSHEALTWFITVERRNPGRWAVFHGYRCLAPDAGWHHADPAPAGDCVRNHRYDLDTALGLAREYLPLLRFGGLTSLDVLAQLPDPPDLLAEVRADRPWRDRCGEPGAWPVRCKRSLAHPTPHAGTRDALTVETWPGEGNAVSAQNRAHKCFGGAP